MVIRDAYALIKDDSLKPGKQIWCDLGCGAGTFTLALAELLPAESIIYAVDQNAYSLSLIPADHSDVTIRKHHADFINEKFPFADLNGILMANSLHYVREKAAFIRKVEEYAKPDFKFLIVEYDTDTPNNWVPYPLSFQSLKTFFTQNGYSKIVKLNERKSIYNSGKMYSALISKS